MKKVLSVILSIAIALATIAFAIAVPISFRPFYYVQIDALEIEQRSGFSRDTIVDAFDSVMDYLHGKGEFSVGTLKYSVEGKDHFVDCKFLFDLDYTVLLISAVLIIAVFVICSFAKIKPHKFLGFAPSFFSGVGILAVFTVVGIIGIINFDFLFTAFHKVFFPGKSNWVFDWYSDEIIRILPQEFFASCAALIFGIILVITLLFIIVGVKKRQKNDNR